jgi:hypothetical protein
MSLQQTLSMQGQADERAVDRGDSDSGQVVIVALAFSSGHRY